MKTEKNSRYKTITATLFVVVALFILQVSVVSALEFDNIKSVKGLGRANYPNIEIKNSFGLGKTLWAGELTRNTNTCGINCEAEQTIVLGEDGSLIDDVYFETILDDGSRIRQDIRNYQFYIKTKGQTKVVDDYEYQCVQNGVSENGTNLQTCTNAKIGSHIEDMPDWTPYNIGDEVEAGTYEIKLEGGKKPSRTVDWVIKTNGKWINEWAVWEGTVGGIINAHGISMPSLSTGNLNKGGMRIVTNYQMKLLNMTVGITADPTTEAYLSWGNGTIITQSSFGAGGIVTFNSKPILLAGEEYLLLTDQNGATSSNYRTNGGFSFPVNLDAFNITMGMNQASGLNDTTNIWDIMTVGTEKVEGITTLNFPSDASISDTNEVTFNATATVTGGATLVNMSLWTNETGNWNEYNVTELINQSNFALSYSSPSTESSSPRAGLSFTVVSNTTLTTIEKTTACTGDEAYLYEATDADSGTLLATETYTGNTATFNYDLDSSKTYFIMAGLNGGGSYTRALGSASYPQTTEQISVNGFVILDSGGLQTNNYRNIEKINTEINPNSWTQTWNRTLTEGIIWNVQACDSDGDCGFSSSNYSLSIDMNAPSINVENPNGTLNYGKIGANETLNITFTDTNLDSCWYNYNGTNISIDGCVSGVKNSTKFLLESGNTNMTIYSNDTIGNLNTTVHNWEYSVIENSRVGSATSYVLTSETFSIDLTGTVNYAYIVFNGTKTLLTKSGSVYSATINMLSDYIGTQTYYYEIASGGEVFNSSSSEIIVTDLGLQDCVEGGVPILNLSIYDEELNSYLNVTSPNTARVELYLILTSLVDDTAHAYFNMSWENNQTMAVCLTEASGGAYYIDIVASVVGTDHVTEFWYLDNGLLNTSSDDFNSYTDDTVDLMDLLAEDSTTFLFEYSDEDNQRVDDIIVHTFRNYIGEGLYREVERSKQDNAGQTHVHLVEEDVIYYFMITKDGDILYTSDVYNAKCLSSPCTITLSASATDTNWSMIDNDGGKYATSSDRETRTVSTTFNLDTISTVNVSLYKMMNASGVPELIETDSLTATAGTVDFVVPISYDNSTFFVSIYKDDEFVKSSWVSMEESGVDYFGTFGAILGALIVLAMMLMAVTEGVGFIVVTILAVIIIGIMQLVDLGALAIISIVCAGGVIVWKLVGRRGVRQ